jgi:hypothetical protein
MNWRLQMAYNLFLDDFRDPRVLKDLRTWVIVRNYNDFVKIITERGLPDLISFDHDLSFEHYPTTESDIPDYNTYKEKTGYHCASWLIDYCLHNDKPLPEWQVHSMNPVGRKNIAGLLIDFRRYQESRFEEIHNEPENIQNEIT